MRNPETPMDETKLAHALASLDAPRAEPDLPDAAILWRKARLLEALEARRNAARPVQVAHTVALTLASGALVVLAGSKEVSLLAWMERYSTDLTLPLTLALFLLGAGLFLVTGAAAGRNLARRGER